MSKFKLSVIALSVVTLLTACDDGDDGVDLGCPEQGDEVRHGEGKDDVSAHIGHGLRAELDEVTVWLHGTDGHAVEPAGNEEDNHQDSDDGVEEGPQSAIGTAQDAVGRHGHHENDQQRAACVEPVALKDTEVHIIIAT